MNSALPAGAGESIYRTLSRTFSGQSQQQQQYDENDEEDADSAKTRVDEWRLAAQFKQMHMSDQAEGRKVGVTWKDLSVQVMPSDTHLQENALSQFNIPRQIKESRQKPELKTILDCSFGSVKPGEMLLVLGKPGSGCTTLLKMLANKRKG